MIKLKNKIAIMFVECDNCEEVYIVDEDYIHDFFTV